MQKSFLFNLSFTLIFICIGIVIGSMISSLAMESESLGWLSYSLAFGTPEPVYLDLHVIGITFGINLNISVAVAICTVISILLSHRLISNK